MYAGVIIAPACADVTVSSNTIHGMALSNPGNDSPLSYGILVYGNSAADMPVGTTIIDNDIYGIAGSAISLGSFTQLTTITNNQLIFLVSSLA